MYSLRNRSALITGGSRYVFLLFLTSVLLSWVTRGLGALVARKYAAEGCNVAINYASSKDDADNLAAEIREKYKVNAVTIQGVCYVCHL